MITYYIINPSLFGGNDLDKKIFHSLNDFRKEFPEEERNKITTTVLSHWSDFIIEGGTITKNKGIGMTMVCVDDKITWYK